MAGKDFEAVKSAALAQAPILLAEWLGGARHGNEWHAERRANGGPGDSWKVNLDSGVWKNFSGSEKGGDLIDLYANLKHLDLGPACDELAEIVGVNSSPHRIPVLPTSRPRARPDDFAPTCDPIPTPTPPLPERFGTPEISRYGDAFLVARYEPKGEKKYFKQFTWRRGQWVNLGYPGCKPLYRDEELRARPTASILLVEGEKSVHAAQEMLPQYVVMTWAGGASSYKNNQWDALKDREVTIWPDADKPGLEVAVNIKRELLAFARGVRVVRPPDDVAPKWDLADAAKEGWDGARIIEWIEGNSSSGTVRDPSEQEPKAEYIARSEQSDDYEFGVPPRSALVLWQQLGLAAPLRKMPHATLSNASLIIRRHQAFAKKFWLDSFRDRIFHTLEGEPKELNDTIVRRVAAYVQESMQLPKFSVDVMFNGIVHAAECNARNSLLDWLNSLKWDGVERLDDWLVDSLGLEKSAYTMAVSRNWPISMVARAFEPGCQADHMPILEDRMGEGKSSFLKILGGEWFGSITKPIGDRAFIEDIQGLWLVEIPDMTGFGKREHSLILATVTTLTDRQRPPYGRTTQNYKRQCIFAATSETSDWLQEGRGSRRFWPLTCGKVGRIDLDNLRGAREQVFAESVHRYKAGATWHEVPKEEAEREQLARTSSDPWTQKIAGYAMTQPVLNDGRTMVYVDRILTDDTCIGMPVGHQDAAAQKRVIRVLKADGWETDKYKGHRCWAKIIP